jgi:hypothetical protein
MIPTSCPRCNSQQNFVPKLREVESWQEEYIRCTVCRWEKVLRQTTPEIEANGIKLKKYQMRAQYEVNRHGMTSVATGRRVTELQQERQRLLANAPWINH